MSKTKSLTIKQGEARNSWKQCAHEGCYNRRDSVSRYCLKHYRIRAKYGSPDGRHMYKKYYAQEKLEIQSFLKKHMEHPGIISALKWLSEWQHLTISSDPIEAKAQPAAILVMYRLRVAGVTPLDILTEAASLFLYSRRYPSKLPDNQLLTVAISRAIYYLSPSDKRQNWNSGALQSVAPTAKERDGIGQRVRDVLGRLLMNIIDGMQAEVEAKAAVRDSFSAPFSTDPVSLL